MGDLAATDYMLGVLQDPFGKFHMGMTAENVAQHEGIIRQMQDDLALESQRRATRAIAQGHFRQQIVPIEIATRKGTVVFDTDEHVRADITAERLAKIKPAFRKEGSVTAGNAPGINGGASAVMLASGDACARRVCGPWHGWSATPMRASIPKSWG